jgi:hypothetical protein
MSTVRAARYRRLALLEPDKEKSRILQLLAEEAERGILCPVDRPSNSTVSKNSSDRPPKSDAKWYFKQKLSAKISAQGEGEMIIRALVIIVAICFSANAFARDKPPKVGNKPLVLVKPKGPTGCKLVGTVKATKLWAGDCVASELRGATPRDGNGNLSRHHPVRNSRAGAEGEGE